MRALARVRFLLARHPAIYWAVVAMIGVRIVGALDSKFDELDDARRSWTETRVVWVAVADHETGDRLQIEARTLPMIAVPARALVDETDAVAVRTVGLGEILTMDDVGVGPRALLPPGHQGIAVELTTPALPVSSGDLVGVVGPTGLLVERSLVLSVDETTAVIAVPGDQAVAVAAAAREQTVTLTWRAP